MSDKLPKIERHDGFGTSYNNSSEKKQLLTSERLKRLQKENEKYKAEREFATTYYDYNYDKECNCVMTLRSYDDVNI